MPFPSPHDDFDEPDDRSSSDLFAALNSAQVAAASHVAGPLLVLAGPGSGKTRVITHRIAHLLRQGVQPHQIVALTFTNKAAEEMRNRVHALTNGAGVWLSTFHRFCCRLLRQYGSYVGLPENFTIYDTDDSVKALKRTMAELGMTALHVTPDRVARAISWAKNHLGTPENFEPRRGNPVDQIVAEVFGPYQARLLSSAAVDFDDLLLAVWRMLRENPELRASLDARYRYILVDEYQDTNLVQYGIVRALSIDHPNLGVTGDPDQSIYGWRGANLSNILEFEQDFPTVKVVRLEQNYRSTQRIVQAADVLIAHNKRRKEKSLFTENEEGRPVRLTLYPTNRDEADSIASQIAEAVRGGRRRPRDFAIFYRINALSRSLELALRMQGVPFQVVHGVEFFQRREVKDVIAYLTLVNNPRDDIAFERVYNNPPRGIGGATFKKLVADADQLHKPLLDAARQAGLIEGLSKQAATKIAKFVSLIDKLRTRVFQPIGELVRAVLDESGYREMLIKSTDDDDIERLANIEELVTAAAQFDESQPSENRLEAFLEQTSLVNDTDDWEADSDHVTMMTLHASKGLEFPVVFIVAVEQGVLPHERTYEEDRLEEERRLLFVGITRAKEELNLSTARYREFRGQSRITSPSDFLMEMPREAMEIEQPGGDFFAPSTQYPQGPGASNPREPRLPRPRSSVAFPGLKTASDMVGVTQPAEAFDAFHEQMAVVHPEYGEGTVVSITGLGPYRTATIDFAKTGLKKFVLEKSQLRPA